MTVDIFPMLQACMRIVQITLSSLHMVDIVCNNKSFIGGKASWFRQGPSLFCAGLNTSTPNFLLLVVIGIWLLQKKFVHIWVISKGKIERFIKRVLNKKDVIFFQIGQNFVKNWLVPLSGCYSSTFVHCPASNIDKYTYKLSVTVEPSVPPPPFNL